MVERDEPLVQGVRYALRAGDGNAGLLVDEHVNPRSDSRAQHLAARRLPCPDDESTGPLKVLSHHNPERCAGRVTGSLRTRQAFDERLELRRWHQAELCEDQVSIELVMSKRLAPISLREVDADENTMRAFP
jgi:hypothetical protein